MRVDLGPKLRKLLAEQNICGAELARRMNCTHSNVSHWLGGRIVPGWERLFKLADMFKISLDELLGRQK
jgi:transcriptional regulator with XRE-family HTH domain